MDSTGALAFPEVPKRLLVVGAGAIGLELGSVWNRLGSEVTVVEFLDRIAPFADRELTGQLQKSLEKQGIRFLLSTKVTGAAKQGEEASIQTHRKVGIVLLVLAIIPFIYLNIRRFMEQEAIR